MRKINIIILTVICLLLLTNTTWGRAFETTDASGELPKGNKDSAQITGGNIPDDSLADRPGTYPGRGLPSTGGSAGGELPGLISSDDDNQRRTTPGGGAGSAGRSWGGMFTGGASPSEAPGPYSGGIAIGQLSETATLDKRLAVLESTKQDLTVWVTLFVAIVSILIALNIGLSVLQVGSIARREVEESIKGYDKQFHGILSKDAKAIDDQIKSLESKLLALGEKLDRCDSVSENKLKQITDTLTAYRIETNNILSKFAIDYVNLKESAFNEIENFYIKKIQDLDSK